jgi:type III pantothenate kinase
VSVLLIDAGNARLKWAEQRNGSIGSSSVAESGNSVQQAVAELRASISGSVEAIAVSNVAGPALEAALHEAFSRGECSVSIWFARSTPTAGGVRNAYAQPEQLGVDRWAALVGAWARLRAAESMAPVCVVDAGTALTIDGLDSNGAHRGGLILPGLSMQRAALLDSTADIAPRARSVVHPDPGLELFATDTASALDRSGAIACAAAVDRCAQVLGSASAPARIMLTGGDADGLTRWLACDYEICPNLVLEGLAILFAQRSLD